MNLSELERVSNRDDIIPAAVKGKGLVKFAPGNQARKGGCVRYKSAIIRLWQVAAKGIPLPADYSDVDAVRFAANAYFPLRKPFFPGDCQATQSYRPLAGGSENPSRGDGFIRLFVSNSIPQRSATRNCWPRGSCRLTFCQEVRNDALRF